MALISGQPRSPTSPRSREAKRAAPLEDGSAGPGPRGARAQAAFAFLLEREAKESILARFDVTVIGRYFPEFEREISRVLGTAR